MSHTNRLSKLIGLSRLGGPVLLLASRYLTSIVGPLVSLLVVRYLGPELFGKYASALAVTGLFGIIADFGLQQAALEAVGTGKYALPVVVRASIGLGALCSTVAYSLSAAWVFLGGYERITAILVLYQGLAFLQTPLLTTITVGLQTKGLYSRIALWNWAVAASRWAGALAAMLLGAGIQGVVVWPLLLSWLVTIGMFKWEISWGVLARGRDGAAAQVLPLRDLLRRSWRFGVAGTMHQVYHRSDTVLLSLMRTPIEVGYYSVAFRVVELLNAFPAVMFGQVLYPKYFRWFAKNRARVTQYYHMTSKWMVAIGIAGATVVSLFARDLITLVFGSHQAGAATLLAVMAWAVPARFVAASPGALLTTGGHIDKKLRVQAGMVLANVGLNIALIPTHGAVASSFVMVVTDTLLLAWYAVAVWQVQGFRLWDAPRTAWSAWLLVITALGITVAFATGGTGKRLMASCLVLAAVSVNVVTTASSGDYAEFTRLLGRNEMLG